VGPNGRYLEGPIQSSGLGAGCFTRLGNAVCLILLLGYGVLWSGTVQQMGGSDNYVRHTPFLATITGARIVAAGTAPLLYDRPTQEAVQAIVLEADAGGTSFLPYREPPLAALALAPFVGLGLPYSLIFTIWAVVTTTAAGLCIGLLAGRWPAPRGTPWLLMLAATSFLPLISSLMLGQSTVLVLLGGAGLTAGLKSRQDLAAGAVAALTAMQPVALVPILVLLLAARRWAALAGLAATLGGVSLVVAPWLGPTWLLQYAALALAPAAPGGVALGLGALLTIGMFWLWRRQPWQPATMAWDLRWAIGVLAGVLLISQEPALALVLAIVPGWIMAAQLANGRLPPAQRRFWLAWLWIGYAIGLGVALLPGALLGGAVLWLLGALGGGIWSLEGTRPAPSLSGDPGARGQAASEA